eukprot:2402040-Amphidinium_carterae.1
MGIACFAAHAVVAAASMSLTAWTLSLLAAGATTYLTPPTYTSTSTSTTTTTTSSTSTPLQQHYPATGIPSRLDSNVSNRATLAPVLYSIQDIDQSSLTASSTYHLSTSSLAVDTCQVYWSVACAQQLIDRLLTWMSSVSLYYHLDYLAGHSDHSSDPQMNETATYTPGQSDRTPSTISAAPTVRSDSGAMTSRRGSLCTLQGPRLLGVGSHPFYHREGEVIPRSSTQTLR